MTCPGEVIDLRPARARLLGVTGDPLGFRLYLKDEDGAVVDVSAWDWAATITTGRARLAFECYPDAAGVSLFMRGDDTARIPPRAEFPFDVAARQPTAGEGQLVLSGQVVLEARVTDPLRSDPDLAPADVVPA